MGEGTVFLVPRRPDGGHRDRLWSWCRSHWHESCPGIPIVEGASPPGPFNRSAAINAAADRPWDVAVILDADVVAPGEQVYEAVELARDTGRMVLGFTTYLGLNALMTRRVMEEGLAWRSITRAAFTKRGHESSIVVVNRELWETVGGFDERFVGWGQEDVAFAKACRLLIGEEHRVEGRVYHLHHSRSAERSRHLPEWRANQALGKRYRETTEAGAMRELLAQRRQTFTRIWEGNDWNGTETPAGPGSTMTATTALREALPKIVEEFGISSILDAGCADAKWMPDLPGYVGVDIIVEAIEMARDLHPERTYLCLDICSDDLPRCEAVLVRDALQHLSLRDGLTALQNFRRTGAKWLLASSHTDGENTDVPTGGWYASNLEAAPFWLGPPRWKIADGTWESGNRWPTKIFGLWEL